MMSVLSVDVECVATGRGHSDHSVCRVAVVDENKSRGCTLVLMTMRRYTDITGCSCLISCRDHTAVTEYLKQHLTINNFCLKCLVLGVFLAEVHICAC